ncbi:CusA/CzcA family heavy metal efflux RND transporter [Leptospira perolatii]|uniref:CusA/CzcA family heavy metal efflux RND transporter n=1 Tax=Leptospira perolatii TaxID=2023191 RepID=A0A2M9ZP12_9LEPT|nr:efflux RND transporter permease subunit [Leptospira perolatii]PJZ69676.1 CusA/CzcA family heavy metal efflux RND transporter [Leptospira perolatii]PJZ73663.1 CusA/CzcA family heavy metal efflux RND transporter [Leptospira perolatii]
MVNRLIRFCIENGFIITIAIIGIVFFGLYSISKTPVDAIPDIGEKQVIVFADWPGRSPQDIDNQVTYPLTISLSGTPGVKNIRSMSGFGFSMVFVVFKEEFDYYWARSRVIERINVAQQRLPSGVVPVLGPDATALGQVFWYTVEGEGYDLAELRSAQDWFIRYQLNSVEGVSEVASIGGFVKQYQIDVDPEKLRVFGVSHVDLYEAVMKSNIDVGAKVIEKNGIEYFIRGVGFIKSISDIENIVLKEMEGVPIYIKNVATVSLGPDFRRGSLDKGGQEAVGGIVLMRYGENPLRVIERVKAKISTIQNALPKKTLGNGTESRVKIVPYYDRTQIVEETLDTLKEALFEEALLAGAIILIFLMHFKSSLSVIATLPLSILLCFILMYFFGVDSNIMSLSGLAIAIGDVGDMGIIMTENIYRHVTNKDDPKPHLEKVYEGAAEVSGAIVTAVTNTIVSFIPVFFLTDQEGKLFKPLAFTKTFAIGASVVLALTVVPFLCYLLYKPRSISRSRALLLSSSLVILVTVAVKLILNQYVTGTGVGWTTSFTAGVIVGLFTYRALTEEFIPLEKNHASRFIIRIYEPALRWVLENKKRFMVLPLGILVSGITVWLGIGTVLKPLELFVNLFSFSEASPELKHSLYIPHDKPYKRPLLELSYMKFSFLQNQHDKSSKFHFYLRRPDPKDLEADKAEGWEVTSEARVLPGIGREFMPPLDEGSILYMPSLLPQTALSEVVNINRKQDEIIASIPEVESVVGKLGRSDSALDPAPIGMIESIISLKPETEWRNVSIERFYSSWPKFLQFPFRFLFPDSRRITKKEILEEIQAKTNIPGVIPTFLQPIQTRLIMLQTGFRAMMGVKIYGTDLKKIETLGLQIEEILKKVPGATDVVADRIVGKPYIELVIDRERIARYGISIRDVQDAIEIGIGGMNITETVEERERYPVRVRYLRDYREDIPELGKVLVSGMNKTQIPLSQLVSIRTVLGPQEIKGEKGLLVGYVTMNTRDRDEISVVEDAEATLQDALKSGHLTLPAGCFWEWSGQFENQQRAANTMKLVIPVCLMIMFLLLYAGFKRKWIAFIVYFGVLVSVSGGFIFLSAWGANLSVAVWVGFLVLFGVVDDDAVVISSYLEDIFDKENILTVKAVREAVVQAGVKRIRPCIMTISTTIFGLAPIFLTNGRGSDVMQPMAIPSVGGMTVSLITLFIAPCLFCAIEEWKLGNRPQQEIHTAGRKFK